MTRPFVLAWLLVELAGCVMGPNDGTAVDGPVIGATFSYNGYSNTPSDLITLEVMRQPELDPALAASWVPFGTTISAATPTYINDTSPLYAWSTVAAPVPTSAEAGRWRAGGVLRTRARRASGGVLDTFDQPTFLDCVIDHYGRGDTWSAIGTACAGVSTKASNRTTGTVGLASTSRTPLDLPAAEKPDWLGRKPDTYQDPLDPARDETTAYYNAWGAPARLADFKATYGFAAGDVSATFYNDGDLGLGRDMHCRAQPLAAGLGRFVACYVTNYSGVDNVPAFGVDPAVVLDDAVHHRNEFATVAMVYRELTALNVSEVYFVVYNKAGDRVTRAQLDSVGRHTSVPSVCIACHGITSRYDAANHRIVDNFPTPGAPAARFLAFDPFSYLYSGVAGFTQADQLDKFRQLNAIINQTRPGAATQDLIAGMYSPNVDSPTAVTNPDYVPAGWAAMDASQDGKAIYVGVVKPGCRMCHASASDASIDFLQGADWAGRMYRIRSLVCGKTVGGVRGHNMPNAEHVAKRFWATGGRALLVSYTQPFQRDPLAASGFPDLNASCDP